METGYVTEIPSYLKQLARLISYAFYQVEDTLIVDMLVRHPCMKEKDMEELLKFDQKLLRARMATLKSEKFVQLRLRMETGSDGKAQKVNYYFINYKSLVNVIKYKLDHMRKRMETQERDATNRASFKCTNPGCQKSFTDLEAGQLFDPFTQEFRCTFCTQLVVEDESAGPKTDSRLMVARFNDQMEMIYELLRKAEDIKLAPELLEPEPPRNSNDPANNEDAKKNAAERGNWSGEATRLRGINDQTRVDIRIGDAAVMKPAQEAKERPVWMTESTIGVDDAFPSTSNSTSLNFSRNPPAETVTTATADKAVKDEIMAMLMMYESKDRRPRIPSGGSDPDKDEEENGSFGGNLRNFKKDATAEGGDSVGVIESDDDDQVTLVQIGPDKIPINEITDELIDRMTEAEKETYIEQYQEVYAYLHE